MSTMMTLPINVFLTVRELRVKKEGLPGLLFDGFLLGCLPVMGGNLVICLRQR